jgi:hypothetical protein
MTLFIYDIYGNYNIIENFNADTDSAAINLLNNTIYNNKDMYKGIIYYLNLLKNKNDSYSINEYNNFVKKLLTFTAINLANENKRLSLLYAKELKSQQPVKILPPVKPSLPPPVSHQPPPPPPPFDVDTINNFDALTEPHAIQLLNDDDFINKYQNIYYYAKFLKINKYSDMYNDYVKKLLRYKANNQLNYLKDENELASRDYSRQIGIAQNELLYNLSFAETDPAAISYLDWCKNNNKDQYNSLEKLKNTNIDDYNKEVIRLVFEKEAAEKDKIRVNDYFKESPEQIEKKNQQIKVLNNLVYILTSQV